MEFTVGQLKRLFKLPHRKTTPMKTYLEQNEVKAKNDFLCILLVNHGCDSGWIGISQFARYQPRFGPRIDFVSLYERWKMTHEMPIFSIRRNGFIEKYCLSSKAASIEDCSTPSSSKRQRTSSPSSSSSPSNIWLFIPPSRVHPNEKSGS